MLKAKQMAEGIKAGSYDKELANLYGEGDKITGQRERYAEAIAKFVELYGDKDIEIYSAPGRSEICGNHTDHQHGKVLAAAIDLDIIAIVSKNTDDVINMVSDNHKVNPIDIKDREIKKEEEGTTESLIRGVVAGLKNEGYEIGGFDAYLTSSVLRGSGLSSSAAFENAVGTIISGLYNDMKVSPVTLAKIGQYAENEYFGKPSGLMDQMASCVGGFIKIDFADVKNPEIKKLNIGISQFGYRLCIVDTKGSHADLTDDYAAIQREMKAVAAYFGKDYLNEVDSSEFFKIIKAIREKEGDRAVLRAIHYFREVDRVDSAVESLEKSDFEGFKNVIKSSGDSSFRFLQNVTTGKDAKVQEMALAIAVSENVLKGGNGVSRVHGGGFAGTIQAFVKSELVNTYKEAMEELFGEGSCYILDVRKDGGVKVIA